MSRLIHAAIYVAFLLPVPSIAQTPPLPEATTAAIRAIIDERDIRYTQRFNDQEKAVSAALAAAEKAVLKAEAASDKRFELLNELRGALTDQSKTVPTRVEVDIRFKAIEEKIAALDTARIQAVGRVEGANWLWGLMLGLGGMFGGLMLGGAAMFGTLRAKAKSSSP